MTARVLIVGAGGLGCPAALVLAQAGVSSLTLLDDDVVDRSNLHRQVLHRDEDAGRPKVASARDALARIAPSLEVTVVRERLGAANALALVARHDLVLDGADNFPTKFLINDACVRARVPFVHAGAVRWSGQLLAVAVGAPCYRCLFEAPPSAELGVSCREAGVVGPLVGLVGALQAEAGLALLDGERDGSTSELRIVDGLTGTERRVLFRNNPGCAACGGRAPAVLDPAAYEVSAC